MKTGSGVLKAKTWLCEEHYPEGLEHAEPLGARASPKWSATRSSSARSPTWRASPVRARQGTQTKRRCGNWLPSWDGSPTTKRDWYQRLADYLRIVNPRYVQLWEEGTTMEKSVTLTVNPIHSNDLNAERIQRLRFEDRRDGKY